jgi:hypothetical protein
MDDQIAGSAQVVEETWQSDAHAGAQQEEAQQHAPGAERHAGSQNPSNIPFNALASPQPRAQGNVIPDDQEALGSHKASSPAHPEKKATRGESSATPSPMPGHFEEATKAMSDSDDMPDDGDLGGEDVNMDGNVEIRDGAWNIPWGERRVHFAPIVTDEEDEVRCICIFEC